MLFCHYNLHSIIAFFPLHIQRPITHIYEPSSLFIQSDTQSLFAFGFPDAATPYVSLFHSTLRPHMPLPVFHASPNSTFSTFLDYRFRIFHLYISFPQDYVPFTHLLQSCVPFFYTYATFHHSFLSCFLPSSYVSFSLSYTFFIAFL